MFISIATAFFAGLVSFLSPCVISLVPAFLSYLAGTTVSSAVQKRREIFLNTLCFVFGFTLVFALLGVLLNTLLESIAYDVQMWLSRLGGAFIIFFGMYLFGVFRIPFLERELKISVKTGTRSRYLTSFLFGASFAAGWTPCVGAVLGGILGLAVQEPGIAFSLLFSYALGLAFPFLLTGLFTAQASAFINRYQTGFFWIRRIFAVVLIVIGVLVFTQTLNRFANFVFIPKITLEN